MIKWVKEEETGCIGAKLEDSEKDEYCLEEILDPVDRDKKVMIDWKYWDDFRPLWFSKIEALELGRLLIRFSLTGTIGERLETKEIASGSGATEANDGPKAEEEN